MNYVNLVLEISEQIATVTINRSQAMNALTVQTTIPPGHANPPAT